MNCQTRSFLIRLRAEPTPRVILRPGREDNLGVVEYGSVVSTVTWDSPKVQLWVRILVVLLTYKEVIMGPLMITRLGGNTSKRKPPVPEAPPSGSTE